MATALRLAAVALLISGNAFFVAVEFSLVAADRTRIEREADQGSRAAARAAAVLRRLSFHLSGAQLGITTVSLLLGFLAEPAVSRVLRPVLDPVLGSASRGVSVVLALASATVTQMVLGELVPKAVAIARADRLVLRLAPFALAYAAVVGPVVRVMNGLADRTVRRLGIEPREGLGTSRTLDEILVVIDSAAEVGEIDPRAREMLERSIRFQRKTAAEALIPRVDVVALPTSATLTDLAATSIRTGYSRFPVYEGDLDDVRGVVHVKQIFAVPFEERARTPVTSVMDPPFVVPETKDLDSLLVEMGTTGHHLAIVVDEYGGVAGIITAEDVLEEIVGTIDDEHDPRTPPLVARDGEDYLLAGTLHPDEVEQATGLELPEGEYETLAGFLLDRFGRLPAAGDEVTHRGWRFVVDRLDRRRVSRVRAIPPPAVGPADEAQEGDR
jgi:CBS domain containing-hemolysin-like protein